MKTEHLIDDRTRCDKQQLDRACTRFPRKTPGTRDYFEFEFKSRRREAPKRARDGEQRLRFRDLGSTDQIQIQNSKAEALNHLFLLPVHS
jgi:hypothetical protein